MIGVVGVLASLLSKWIKAVHDGDADTEFILPDKKKQKSEGVKEEFAVEALRELEPHEQVKAAEWTNLLPTNEKVNGRLSATAVSATTDLGSSHQVYTSGDEGAGDGAAIEAVDDAALVGGKVVLEDGIPPHDPEVYAHASLGESEKQV